MTGDRTLSPKAVLRSGCLQCAVASVQAGSTVFIPGSSEHGIRNTGPQALRFFCALAADDFTEVEARLLLNTPRSAAQRPTLYRTFP